MGAGTISEGSRPMAIPTAGKLERATGSLWRLSETTLVGDDDYALDRSMEKTADERALRSPAVRIGKKKTGNKQIVKVNTTCCKYDIVRNCSRKCGFRVVDDMEQWSLFWIDTGVSVQRVLDMEPYQKINHFPGMHEICRKDHLARNLSRLSRLLPKEYNFFPKTWTLPLEWEDLKMTMKSKKGLTFIAKPDHGCQGKGIFLFRSLKSISPHKGSNLIVQSYIPKPFLIDNLKFDLRVYVLVTSVDPLRIFIHRSGLARFATQKYSDPTDANMGDVCMHLTNYAINKHSNNFVRGDADDRGSKRTLASVLKMIEDRGKATSAELWDRIEEVIVKTLLTIQPQLGMILRACFPSTALNKGGNTKDSKLPPDGKKQPKVKGVESQCFEILGFDIFLDNKLKPWVLEVNHSPSFTCDSPIDVRVKEAVIVDTLKMIDFTVADKKRFMKEEKEKQRTRLFGGKENIDLKAGVGKSLLESSVMSQNASAYVLKECPANVPTELSRSLDKLRNPESDQFNDTLDISRPTTSGTAESLYAEKSKPRAISSSGLELISQYHSSYPYGYLDSLKRYEDTCMGSFVRAFPPEQPHKLSKYLKCLASSRNLFSDTKTTRRRREFLQKQKEKVDEDKKGSKWRERTESKSKDLKVKPRYMDWNARSSSKAEVDSDAEGQQEKEDELLEPEEGEHLLGTSFSHFHVPVEANPIEKTPLRVNVESLNDRLQHELRVQEYKARNEPPPKQQLYTPTSQSSDMTSPPIRNFAISRPISAPRIMTETEAQAIRSELARKRQQRAFVPPESKNGVLFGHRIGGGSNDDAFESYINDDQPSLGITSEMVDELLKPPSVRASRASSAGTVRSLDTVLQAPLPVPVPPATVKASRKPVLMTFPFPGSKKQHVASIGKMGTGVLQKSLMISRFRPKYDGARSGGHVNMMMF
ncbi:Tubulin polyglutamylase ttll6 [Dinochytrium kinnereticum]|nr:Tubulin polyglutamylase ttll6 [Dinochytrium kinnereticum]